MKKNVLIALSLMLLCILPSFALANRTLVIQNENPFSTWASIAYQEKSGRWVVHGWWKMEPRRSRTIHVNTHNRYVYIYAENLDERRYYSGGRNDRTARNYNVVREGFKFAIGKVRGREKRLVRFKRVDFGNAKRLTYTLFH